VLLEANRNALVCGWSNSKKFKRELFFALGDIAVTMLIGRTPFIGKDIKHDQYGKFLKEGLINKLWESLERSTSKRFRKTFKFS
jgi:hypothetical protein